MSTSIDRSGYYLIFLAMILSACRIMPIQMTRVTQTETFSQSFDFGDAHGIELHDKVTEVLTSLIGKKNYDILIDIVTEIEEDAVQGRVQAKGQITANLSIVPTDHDRFFIDGSGRYLLVVKKSADEEIILYSADFAIIPEYHEIDKLGVEPIGINFKQYLVNHFTEPNKKNNYVHDEPVNVFLHINKLEGQKDVYYLDYDAQHEVKIAGNLIGNITFDSPINKLDKLIDLRGKKFIKNDY